jgi:transketolase
MKDEVLEAKQMAIGEDMSTHLRIVREKCSNAALQIRLAVLKMALSAGSVGAHLGGALSMSEILSVLYCEILRYDSQNPLWDQRDRFILSKGHGSPSLYAALNLAGFIDTAELATFKANGTYLSAHPSMNLQKGIEFSSGSLGQGLSLGVGSAIALKRKSNDVSRVFVVLGDGELNEGSVWEAAMSAFHFRLSNLVAIVDKNGLQQDGMTTRVMDMGDLAGKWESFGWTVIQVDGHDVLALYEALQSRNDGPLAIIAHTVKGKGVSFMERNRAWHHSRLTQLQFDQAIAELAPAQI